MLSPQETMAEESIARTIAGCRFQYPDYFDLFAYKGGKVRPLGEMYEEKLLSDEQIGLIHQCYKRYRQEIYRREAWEENTKNQTDRLPLYVCGAGLVLTGIGSAAVCLFRKRKKESAEAVQPESVKYGSAEDIVRALLQEEAEPDGLQTGRSGKLSK